MMERHISEEEQRAAVEKLRGWAQWASLEPLAPEERLSLVISDPTFHTVGLYERLLEASRSYIRTDPSEGAEVARLAVAVAERLDPVQVEDKRAADLRSAGWAALGNALRLAADFESARAAFNEAWRIAEEEGTGDSRVKAEILSLESGYIQDMGEFETAEAALEEALEVYREAGDAHLEGRTLLKMADCIGQVYPERGLAHIRKGLALIDVHREPRLQLCAQHDLAWFLNDSGQPKEALTVLERARPLYSQFPDRWTQLRLHWLEGRIARNLGDLSGAEEIFRQLWEEFRSRNLNHELVLVSIDLAEALVQKGEPSRAGELVERCYPILVSWGMHRYALAAWLVFQDALEQGRIEGIFERIREYYRRHWVKPMAFGG